MCVRMMLAVCFVFVVNIFGYAQVRETTISLGKEKVHAVKMDIDAPAQQVQASLHKFINPSGTPKKAASGSFMHNDIQVKGMGDDSLDVWTRVQKNGNSSTIYLGVKDDSGYISSERDSSKIEQFKKLLYDFAKEQNYKSKDIEIGALMDSVQMDQSGMQERASKRMQLQNQIRELNSHLQELEQQEKTNREAMESRRARLEELRRPSSESTMPKTKTSRSGQ